MYIYVYIDRQTFILHTPKHPKASKVQPVTCLKLEEPRKVSHRQPHVVAAWAQHFKTDSLPTYKAIQQQTSNQQTYLTYIYI